MAKIWTKNWPMINLADKNKISRDEMGVLTFLEPVSNSPELFAARWYVDPAFWSFFSVWFGTHSADHFPEETHGATGASATSIWIKWMLSSYLCRVNYRTRLSIGNDDELINLWILCDAGERNFGNMCWYVDKMVITFTTRGKIDKRSRLWAFLLNLNADVNTYEQYTNRRLTSVRHDLQCKFSN